MSFEKKNKPGRENFFYPIKKLKIQLKIISQFQIVGSPQNFPSVFDSQNFNRPIRFCLMEKNKLVNKRK